MKYDNVCKQQIKKKKDDVALEETHHQITHHGKGKMIKYIISLANNLRQSFDKKWV